jgi:adenosine deaminase CECR1
MPKGAYLYIHFNACLLPNVLLDIVNTIDRIFITSDLPLIERISYDRYEIQFYILSLDKEKPGNIFDTGY